MNPSAFGHTWQCARKQCRVECLSESRPPCAAGIVSLSATFSGGAHLQTIAACFFAQCDAACIDFMAGRSASDLHVPYQFTRCDISSETKSAEHAEWIITCSYAAKATGLHAHLSSASCHTGTIQHFSSLPRPPGSNMAVCIALISPLVRRRAILPAWKPPTWLVSAQEQDVPARAATREA